MSNIEQTLSIIKPDAVERNLSEEIKNEFIKIILINISNKLINDIYPIQYYFEKINHKYSAFCPGINKNLLV